MSRLPKLGILGSGSGSNCQSIYDAIQSGSLRAEIAVVMSDNPDAFILERARSWGIPAIAEGLKPNSRRRPRPPLPRA